MQHLAGCCAPVLCTPPPAARGVRTSYAARPPLGCAPCRRYNLPPSCGLPPGIDDCLVRQHWQPGRLPPGSCPCHALLGSRQPGLAADCDWCPPRPAAAPPQVHFFCFYCASHQVGWAAWAGACRCSPRRPASWFARRHQRACKLALPLAFGTVLSLCPRQEPGSGATACATATPRPDVGQSCLLPNNPPACALAGLFLHPSPHPTPNPIHTHTTHSLRPAGGARAGGARHRRPRHAHPRRPARLLPHCAGCVSTPLVAGCAATTHRLRACGFLPSMCPALSAQAECHAPVRPP